MTHKRRAIPTSPQRTGVSTTRLTDTSDTQFTIATTTNNAPKIIQIANST